MRRRANIWLQTASSIFIAVIQVLKYVCVVGYYFSIRGKASTSSEI